MSWQTERGLAHPAGANSSQYVRCLSKGLTERFVSAALGCLAPNQCLLLRELIHSGDGAFCMGASYPISRELQPCGIQPLEVVNVPVVCRAYESPNARVIDRC